VNAFHAGEVEILREAIVTKVALLKRSPALEGECAVERSNLLDASENPRGEIIPFKDVPRNSYLLSRI